MQKCVAPRDWPDSAAEVLEAANKEFLAHTAECPYHKELLRKAEEPFRTGGRLARSLGTHGRPPLASQERKELDRQDHNYDRWVEQGAPVNSLSLRYRGEEVARHERFLKLDARVTRELNGSGDFQIYKLQDEASGELLLGTYLLDGFNHIGKPWKLPLPNGLVVVVRVNHLSGTKYDIEFICSEPESVSKDQGESVSEQEPMNSDVDVLANQARSSNQQTSVRTMVTILVLLTLPIAAVALFNRWLNLPTAVGAENQPSNVQPSQQDTFSEIANIQGEKAIKERELVPKDSRTQPQPMSGPTKARYTEAKIKEYGHKISRTTAHQQSQVAKAEPGSPAPTATPTPTPPVGEVCFLPAGSELKLFLIKTGDDIKLREIFMSEVKRVNDEAGNPADQSFKQHDRAIHVNLKFEWTGGVGVATATLSDPDGMLLKSFNGLSVASPKLARVLAVHDVVNALFSYLQTNQSIKNAAEEINQDASSNLNVPDLFTVGEEVTKSPTEIAAQ